MHSALHDDDRRATHETGDKPARVALDSGLWKMWNLCAGNNDRLGDRIGHGAQSGAEDNCDARLSEPVCFAKTLLLQRLDRSRSFHACLTMRFAHSTGKSYVLAAFFIPRRTEAHDPNPRE